jgi:predicted DNA-binding protein with PD1-like motif
MLTLSFKVKNKKYCLTFQKGEDLLVSLDNFCKKHKIGLKNIHRVLLDTSQEKSVISIRIAQAILKALKIARE